MSAQQLEGFYRDVIDAELGVIAISMLLLHENFRAEGPERDRAVNAVEWVASRLQEQLTTLSGRIEDAERAARRTRA
ncbi:hypothetical protein J8J14_09560 [Roseomonas sp. SSH11]|uniref:Uncharacterized protein n=1 Tax=Pararoseomonas baculiformis TaxID=2820812 RepID=A0ABS4ADD0_9PROT|nr:hypothetical protein [Pararoseomonas baculiformis]MBP0445026.1 hypothetical protein [Pararoseomonas baculiformis]